MKKVPENYIFWPEIGLGFWEPSHTPQPKILRSTPPSPPRDSILLLYDYKDSLLFTCRPQVAGAYQRMGAYFANHKSQIKLNY